MHQLEAAELAALVKGLFPMLTDQQADGVFEALLERSDHAACRNAIKSYAASYDQLGLASFRNHLPPPAREHAPASMIDATSAKLDLYRAKAREIDQEHAANSKTIAEAPPDLVARVTSRILENMDPELAAFYRRRDLKDLGFRGALADALRRELEPCSSK